MENEPLKALLASEPVLFSLNANESIEFKDARSGAVQKFSPDDTKGFFQFQVATAFPFGMTVYGTGLHPAVVEQSFASLFGQSLNYEHMVAEYFKDDENNKHVRDAYLGTVMAVSYPQAPMGGWKIPESVDKAPAISAVANFPKLAQRIKTIVGEHQTSRHKWSVSMEVQYQLSKSGFAVQLNGKEPKFETPPDMLKAGWEYVPWDQSPEKLQATFSKKKNRITGKWNNRATSLLMGGISNQVHFAGVGLVRYGAERTAKISRLVASNHPMQELADVLETLSSMTGRLRVA